MPSKRRIKTIVIQYEITLENQKENQKDAFNYMSKKDRILLVVSIIATLVYLIDGYLAKNTIQPVVYGMIVITILLIILLIRKKNMIKNIMLTQFENCKTDSVLIMQLEDKNGEIIFSNPHRDTRFKMSHNEIKQAVVYKSIIIVEHKVKGMSGFIVPNSYEARAFFQQWIRE